MRVMRQLHLAGTKADALIAGVARRYGLSHAALNALAVIEGAGGPLPTGEVTAQMRISTATMTSILDTLERRLIDRLSLGHYQGLCFRTELIEEFRARVSAAARFHGARGHNRK